MYCLPCTYPVKKYIVQCRSPLVPIDLQTADDHEVWGMELSDITLGLVGLSRPAYETCAQSAMVSCALIIDGICN